MLNIYEKTLVWKTRPANLLKMRLHHMCFPVNKNSLRIAFLIEYVRWFLLKVNQFWKEIFSLWNNIPNKERDKLLWVNISYAATLLFHKLNVKTFSGRTFLELLKDKRGRAKQPLPAKLCLTFPTMMKRGTVIHYLKLKKIQKTYESSDITLAPLSMA